MRPKGGKTEASLLAEEQAGRVDRSDALQQNEQLFRLMVEAVKDYGIFLLDPDGYITTWNEGAERIKGYTASDIIGRHFSVFYPEEALNRDWPAHELRVARSEGRFEDEGWRVRKDGSQFWANVIITALRAEDGRLIGFTKVTRDLSERRAHEEALLENERQLARTNAELEQRNSDLQDFAHIASHDLREPLRKIRTFAELLDDEYQDLLDEEGQMYIDRIRSSVVRMSTLLNDLLSYSRVTSRANPFVPVDLNKTVADVLSDLQILIEETRGEVVAGELPTIEADASQMRQLFQNLISNALKFHRPGLPPRVTINLAAPDPSPDDQAWAQITLEDNGIGFDQKYADRIFAPFQRLHTRHEYAGSGLGLAICRRITERHGGQVAATSREGGGATFVVTLPYEQASDPEE